ncbi:hypothetical protein, partial [Enterobacter hormaechei]|uniref:hypothetical protein n=1 Tax=Enterobacter hormaechei TaxID=158836 RepID=UPI001BCD0789
NEIASIQSELDNAATIQDEVVIAAVYPLETLLRATRNQSQISPPPNPSPHRRVGPANEVPPGVKATQFFSTHASLQCAPTPGSNWFAVGLYCTQ